MDSLGAVRRLEDRSGPGELGSDPVANRFHHGTPGRRRRRRVPDVHPRGVGQGHQLSGVPARRGPRTGANHRRRSSRWNRTGSGDTGRGGHGGWDRRVHGDAELRCDGSSDGVLCHGRRDGDRRRRLHDHERNTELHSRTDNKAGRGPDAPGHRPGGCGELHGPAERGHRGDADGRRRHRDDPRRRRSSVLADRRRKGDRRRDRRVHGDAELRCDESSDGVLCHGRRDGDRRCPTTRPRAGC